MRWGIIGPKLATLLQICYIFPACNGRALLGPQPLIAPPKRLGEASSTKSRTSTRNGWQPAQLYIADLTPPKD